LWAGGGGKGTRQGGGGRGGRRGGGNNLSGDPGDQVSLDSKGGARGAGLRPNLAFRDPEYHLDLACTPVFSPFLPIRWRGRAGAQFPRARGQGGAAGRGSGNGLVNKNDRKKKTRSRGKAIRPVPRGGFWGRLFFRFSGAPSRPARRFFPGGAMLFRDFCYARRQPGPKTKCGPVRSGGGLTAYRGRLRGWSGDFGGNFFTRISMISGRGFWGGHFFAPTLRKGGDRSMFSAPKKM